MRALLASIFVLSIAVPAAAADRSLFGVALDALLSIPACTGDVFDQDPNLCWITEGRPAPTDGLIVAQLGRTRPSWLAPTQTLWISMVGGKSARVVAHTTGTDAQPAALAALTEKYGPPASFDRQTVSPHGMPMEVIHAQWNLARGDRVTRNGIAGNMLSGEIRSCWRLPLR